MNVIRQRLGWKLFLSYLVIILVGVLTLAVAAQASTPAGGREYIFNCPAGDCVTFWH